MHKWTGKDASLLGRGDPLEDEGAAQAVDAHVVLELEEVE